jgi:hypothetical protein
MNTSVSVKHAIGEEKRDLRVFIKNRSLGPFVDLLEHGAEELGGERVVLPLDDGS